MRNYMYNNTSSIIIVVVYMSRNDLIILVVFVLVVELAPGDEGLSKLPPGRHDVLEDLVLAAGGGDAEEEEDHLLGQFGLGVRTQPKESPQG